jgi:transcriptional regulator with XRE-family HTH domain
MATSLRRTTLGIASSAAIPVLWAASDRLGWTHSEIARRLGVDKAMVAKLMYGDRRAGRDLAGLCKKLLGVPYEAWSQPLPRGWKVPHFGTSSARAA